MTATDSQIPKVSVIVSCYNQEKYIAECLESILNQTYSDYEAVIVDDGSTDRSSEIIASYAAKHPNFRVLKQPNSGVIAARNYAVSQARGEYIIPVDGDDEIKPEMLAKCVKALDEGKGDVIGTDAELFGRLQSRTYMRKPSRINFSAGNQFLSSSMFRKKDFLKCGGYDREFKSGYEDYDLWLNMIFKQKLKGYLIAEPLLRYRIKDRIESRNLAADSNKKTLYKQLLKKYPLMKWIRVFWKIKKIFYNKRFSQKHNKWNIRILSVINIRYKK